MSIPLGLNSSALRWDHSSRLRGSGPRGWIAVGRGRSLGRRLLHRRRVRPGAAALRLLHMHIDRAVASSVSAADERGAEVGLCLTALVVCVVRGDAMELWGQEDDVGMGEVRVVSWLKLAAGAGKEVLMGMVWWVLRVGDDTVGVEDNGDVTGLLLTDGRLRTVDDEGLI